MFVTFDPAKTMHENFEQEYVDPTTSLLLPTSKHLPMTNVC